MTAPHPAPLDALQAIHARRSVRSYHPDVVDAATIHTLLEAAVQAPTARGREPWAFVVVQDRALLRRISDRAKAIIRDDPVRFPPDQRRNRLDDPEASIFYDAGTLIVIGEHGPTEYPEADSWLAAENLMLAATALGLGSCCIGFALFALREPDVKAELGLPPDVAPVAAIIVGVPAAAPAPLGRKAPEIVRWFR